MDVPQQSEFQALLERVHTLGRDVVAAHAAEVDRDARFPVEAFTARGCVERSEPRGVWDLLASTATEILAH